MKAVVAAFNQEKALVGAFSVITILRMELFQALVVVVAGSVTALLPAQSLPKLSQHSDGSLILGPDGRQLQWLRGS